MGWLSRASIYVAMSLPFKLQFAQGASRSIRAPHPFTPTPRTTPVPVTAEKEEGDTSLLPTQVLAPRLSQAAVWGEPVFPRPLPQGDSLGEEDLDPGLGT